MGIILSRIYFESTGRSDDPDPVTGLTSRERILVNNSWKQLQNDATNTGVKICMSLFKKKPEYQKLFSFRDIPYDDLPGNRSFQGHCSSLVYGFSSIIDNVDDTEMLIELLTKQGVAHKPRGVTPEAYDVLYDVLVEIFEAIFTEETIDSWKKTLRVVLPLIVKGGQYKS